MRINTLLANMHIMYAIAVDFGGTKMHGAIVDGKGKICADCVFPTEAEKGRMRIIGNLARLIGFLKKKSVKKIRGIGISMPGSTDKKGKVVFGGGTLTSLVGANLKKELEKRAKLPVFIENDANCFALAEAVYGAGKNCSIVLGVVWGTGIGAGLVVNRRIYGGALHQGREFGHMVVDSGIKTGARCGCGQRGCIEMLASGKNIVRRYLESGGKIKDANVRQIYGSKEPAAKKAIDDAIRYLGIGLADMVDVFNPEIIVLGGSVSRLPAPVYSQLRKEVKKYALPALSEKLKLVRYKISADAGIRGAAALVLG